MHDTVMYQYKAYDTNVAVLEVFELMVANFRDHFRNGIPEPEQYNNLESREPLLRKWDAAFSRARSTSFDDESLANAYAVMAELGPKLWD
jgi:hypothetical protein